MTKQFLLRTAFLCFFFLCSSYTHKAAMASMPGISIFSYFIPASLHKGEVLTAENKHNPTEKSKQQHFQFKGEETAHIHHFCFDKIRRRRRLASLFVCGLARLCLCVVHFTILACHVDHLLHHGLHYLLQAMMM